MSNFFRRIAAGLKTHYTVTVEIKMNDDLIHQVEIGIEHFSKSRAMKVAIDEVAKMVVVKSVSAHRS